MAYQLAKSILFFDAWPNDTNMLIFRLLLTYRVSRNTGLPFLSSWIVMVYETGVRIGWLFVVWYRNARSCFVVVDVHGESCDDRGKSGDIVG